MFNTCQHFTPSLGMANDRYETTSASGYDIERLLKVPHCSHPQMAQSGSPICSYENNQHTCPIYIPEPSRRLRVKQSSAGRYSLERQRMGTGVVSYVIRDLDSSEVLHHIPIPKDHEDKAKQEAEKLFDAILAPDTELTDEDQIPPPPSFFEAICRS